MNNAIKRIEPSPISMRTSALTILLTLTIISYGWTQNIDNLKKKYILDDLNIYIENPLPGDNNPDRYTIDNKVYRIKRRFIFDYLIIRRDDTLKITVPKTTSPGGDFQREWA